MSSTTKGQEKNESRGPRRENPGRFDFMGKAKYFAVFSVVLTIVAFIGIIFDGFVYGIDFAGGTEIQVQFNQAVDASEVRQFTSEMGYPNAHVQAFGEEHEFLIRLDAIQGETDSDVNEQMNEMIELITQGLASTFVAQGAVIRRVDAVGPQIGSELKRNGMLAAFYSLLMILIYIGLRFDYKYAPAAVFCLFHDAIITLGIFALFDLEVNVQTMAAILTLIGYSLNDTIVIFDRVRENTKIYRDYAVDWVFNRSLNDTLSRTLLTSLTTMLAIGAMFIIGTGVIQDFAFTLGIGLILGTYSTIYVASPLVILFDKVQARST